MIGGYSICFNEWALDKEINGELSLLLIISSLSAEKGYCFASNKYLAELFDIREETISRKLKKLCDKGYITIEYEKKGCEITNRFIRLTKLSIHDCEINQSTIDQKVKENNISINNIKESNNINIITKEKFKKPTLEEVEEYCKQRNSSVDAKTFYEYFETGGWVDSKGNKVKNWKQKIITWENNRKRTDIKEEPKWFNQEQNIETISKQDQEEMENILNELRNDS